MTNFLIKKFVKNYKDVNDNTVREKYGLLGGTVGIVSNVLLFIIKFTIGIITNSISVSADAFNNLSDAFGSLVTIVGFKLSNIPADEEHPYGHGRFEYISSLIVSFLVLIVGFSFIKSSVERIMNPTNLVFSWVTFGLLSSTILIKLYLAYFNNRLAKQINSSALKASAIDALSDCFTSGTVIVGLFVSRYTSLPVDGIIGIIVAAAILYAGYQLAKETSNLLIGEKASKELIENIETEILSYPNILGVHDLMIHSYGPNKYLGSIHAEVPSHLSLIEIHEIIDRAEKNIFAKFNVEIVIHMDPTGSEELIGKN